MTLDNKFSKSLIHSITPSVVGLLFSSIKLSPNCNEGFPLPLFPMPSCYHKFARSKRFRCPSKMLRGRIDPGRFVCSLWKQLHSRRQKAHLSLRESRPNANVSKAFGRKILPKSLYSSIGLHYRSSLHRTFRFQVCRTSCSEFV